jgi:double-stranded uracil-DNA glycosylase
VNAPVSRLADVVAPGLAVLFCGINPGLLAAATGHHFAGRGNRFWRVMHLAGFTPHQLAPRDSHTLPRHGCGLTTVVARPTAREDEVASAEYRAAAQAFEQKVRHAAPAFVAFLGKPALAALSGQRQIAWGRQPASIEASAVWVLPNPSGRNRAFSLDQLVAAYRDLQQAAFPPPVG